MNNSKFKLKAPIKEPSKTATKLAKKSAKSEICTVYCPNREKMRGDLCLNF